MTGIRGDSPDGSVARPAPHPVAAVALLVALLSLVLNAYLIWRIRRPERLAAPAIGRVLERLARDTAALRYTVRVPIGTPLNFDIPVDQTYRLRVNTQLPIDTRVTLPIRSPLGRYDVSVPLRAQLPIRLNLPVRIQDTFRLRTATRAEMRIPLETRLRDLPLGAVQRALAP